MSNTSLEIPAVEIPASTLLSQPPRPSHSSEGPLEESSEAPSTSEKWAENIVHAKYVQATDPIEKEALLNELLKLLEKHTIAVCCKKSRDKRMDLVNEALMAIYRYLHTFEHRDGAKFSTWAHQIIERVCGRGMRKTIEDRPRWQQFVEGVIPTNDDGELFIPSDPREEEKVHMKIMLDKMDESLTDENECKLFEMARDGASGKEIADAFGITENAARGRKMRLEKKLNKRFPVK